MSALHTFANGEFIHMQKRTDHFPRFWPHSAMVLQRGFQKIQRLGHDKNSRTKGLFGPAINLIRNFYDDSASGIFTTAAITTTFNRAFSFN